MQHVSVAALHAPRDSATAARTEKRIGSGAHETLAAATNGRHRDGSEVGIVSARAMSSGAFTSSSNVRAVVDAVDADDASPPPPPPPPPADDAGGGWATFDDPPASNAGGGDDWADFQS